MPNVSTMPTIFQIEIPSEFRDKFWDHPEDKLRFWAFKNRPHCFLEEKLLFTFDRRPVAEAKVLKMEDPGKSKCDATGQYEDYWKVFWSPSTFKRYKQKTGASQWMGPVYHGTNKEFEKFNPAESAAGIFYFTDDPDYADSYTQTQGMYDTGANIRPTYIRMNKPFDATAYATKRMNLDEFAKILDNSNFSSRVAKLYRWGWKRPFWNWVITLAEETKDALESKGYDGIIQKENLIPAKGDDKTSYIVFNQSQIRNAYEKQGAGIVYGYTRAKTRIAAFQSWMTAWMTGDCWLFALALAHHMPNASFVGLATPEGVVHHVGLMEGGKYYDVRGAMPEDEFNYATDAEKPMHIVPIDYEQVMRDGEYGSWLGHEDEFNALPDMKKAQKAVRRVFPQFKSASTDEPGLLWRAPEDNERHDYQPTWDYEPRAEQDPELAAIAIQCAKGEYQRTKQPFELHDIDLSHLGAVAMYIDGTCGYPVILIDLEAHRGYEDQIGKSINHELRHAIQDAEGRDYDEDEAEDAMKEASIKTANWRQARDIQRGNWIAERDGVFQVTQVMPEGDEIVALGKGGLVRRYDPNDEVNIWKTGALKPSDEFRFVEECTEAYSGQSNMILRAYKIQPNLGENPDMMLGELRYTVYGGGISSLNCWVSSYYIEQGVGAALVKELQRLYPNAEIPLRDIDDQYDLTSLKIKKEPSEYAEQFKERESLMKENVRLDNIADKYWSQDTHTKEEDQNFEKETEHWNDINDRLWILDQYLNGLTRTKTRIIGAKDEGFVDTEGNPISEEEIIENPEKGFWGTEASGILPVCPSKGTVCLAWRSPKTHLGDCWGSIGGAIPEGLSAAQSAKAELKEETGYGGGVSLLPAYVFTQGTFKYYNFVGIVPQEFAFTPTKKHSWETERIEWVPYAEVQRDMQTNPSHYHPGMLKLFENSGDVIEKALRMKTAAEKLSPTQAGLSSDKEASYHPNFTVGDKVYLVRIPERIGSIIKIRKQHSDYTTSKYEIKVLWETPGRVDSGKIYTYDDTDLRPAQESLDFKEAGDKKAAKTYECNGYKFNKGMEVSHYTDTALIGKITKIEKGSRGEMMWNGRYWETTYWASVDWRDHNGYSTREKLSALIPTQMNLFEKESSKSYECNGRKFVRGMDVVFSKHPEYKGKIKKFKKGISNHFCPEALIEWYAPESMEGDLQWWGLEAVEPIQMDIQFKESSTHPVWEKGMKVIRKRDPDRVGTIVDIHKWDDSTGLQITWDADSIAYTLAYPFWYDQNEIEPAQLELPFKLPKKSIKIASINQDNAKSKTATTYYHGGADIPDETLDVSKGQTGAIFVTSDKEYAQRYIKNNGGGLYTVTLDDPQIFDPRNSDHLEQLQQGFLNLVGGDDYDDEESALSDYHNFIGQGDLMLDWAVAPDAFDAVKTLGFKGMRMRERPGKITKAPDDNGFEISSKPIESVALFDKTVPAKRIAGFTPTEKPLRRKFASGTEVITGSQRGTDELIPIEAQGESSKSSAETFTPISKDEKVLRKKFPIGSKVLDEYKNREGVVKSYGRYNKYFNSLAIVVTWDRIRDKKDFSFSSDSLIPLESQGNLFKPENKTADFDYDVAEKAAEGEQSAAASILDEYKAHLTQKNYRQKWSLVPAARLIKIWNDYAKTGMVRDTKGMDNITGIIVTNIHKLKVNTILCGHEQDDPVKYANSITEETYPENYFEILENFFNDEKGMWRISDFAIKPLQKLAYQLVATANPEEQLQLVDKVLNIVHQRSDLSSWFVQGGFQTLNQLFQSNQQGAKTAIENISVPKADYSSDLIYYWREIEGYGGLIKCVGVFMGFEVFKGSGVVGAMSYVTEIYCIKDKKTTVGLISGYTKKQAFKIYETFIYPKYRGQNIAPQFYAWLLKKNLVQSIISGDEQGKGGKKLWENLAKVPGIMVFAWNRGKAISLDPDDLGGEEFIWSDDVNDEWEELEKDEYAIAIQMTAIEERDNNWKSNPQWIELNQKHRKIRDRYKQLPDTTTTGNVVLVAQKATTKKASIKTAAGTWQQAEQVLQNIDPEHELILFHSGTSDIDQSINEVGLIAEMGEWVEEVLYGATDDDELIQNIREKGGAVFFDETPSWIKAKVERKIKRRATTNDIKKYGQLTLVVADLDGPIRRYIGSGKHGEEVETLRKERWVEDDLPFGLEPGDFFSTEDIAATVTLTGDDLVMFMNKHFPGEIENPSRREKLSADRASTTELLINTVEEKHKTSAQRQIYYHGTDIKNLRSILSEGLVPEGKAKSWADDPNAGMNSPSRQAYGGCYDDETRILTKHRGFQHFYNLRLDDDVATLVNGELVYERPLAFTRYWHEGQMYAFKTRLIDQLITPDHKVYWRNRISNDARQRKNQPELEFQLSEVSSLLGRKGVKSCGAGRVRDYSQKSWRSVEFKRNAEWHCAAAPALFDVPSALPYTTPIKQRKRLYAARPNQFKIDDWLEFLGWYLSEGSLDRKSRIAISQQKPKNREKIKQLLGRMGLLFSENKQGFRFSHHRLYEYLKQFGLAQDKFIPQGIKEFDPSKLGIILGSLLAGDGHCRRKGHQNKWGDYSWIFNSVSQRLAEDVAEIALKCGYGISFGTNKPTTGKFKGNFPSYYICLSKWNPTSLCGKPAIIDFKGWVSCVQVPSGVIFVERNGKTCWSGNSYLTRNMMTAMSAVRNNRSNADYRMVMVIVEAQPNSLFLDEDSIVSILDSPFNNGNQDSSEHLIGQYFMMTLPDAPSSLKEAYQEMQGRYIDKVIERFKYMLTEHKLTMAPDLEKRVRELLPGVLLASLTRRVAHAYKSDEKRTEKDGYDARNYDYRRTYQSIFGQVEAPPKETIIPTPQAGEKKFRETAEQLTRTLRSMLRIQQGGGWALQNARSTEPIGYNGSNHIIAVLEIREGRDLQIKFNDPTGYEGKGTMVPIVVHYGAVPEDFNQQWKERMGYRIYWLKPGETPPPSTYVKPEEPTEKPTEVNQEQLETDPPNAQPARSYVTAATESFIGPHSDVAPTKTKNTHYIWVYHPSYGFYFAEAKDFQHEKFFKGNTSFPGAKIPMNLYDNCNRGYALVKKSTKYITLTSSWTKAELEFIPQAVVKGFKKYFPGYTFDQHFMVPGVNLMRVPWRDDRQSR